MGDPAVVETEFDVFLYVILDGRLILGSDYGKHLVDWVLPDEQRGTGRWAAEHMQLARSPRPDQGSKPKRDALRKKALNNLRCKEAFTTMIEERSVK